MFNSVPKVSYISGQHTKQLQSRPSEFQDILLRSRQGWSLWPAYKYVNTTTKYNPTRWKGCEMNFNCTKAKTALLTSVHGQSSLDVGVEWTLDCSLSRPGWTVPDVPHCTAAKEAVASRSNPVHGTCAASPAACGEPPNLMHLRWQPWWIGLSSHTLTKTAPSWFLPLLFWTCRNPRIEEHTWKWSQMQASHEQILFFCYFPF